MVNLVIIIGRLGKDPETRYLPNGTPVVNFSVATDENYKDKSGERVQKTEWHKVKAFGKLAEICSQWLTKGKQVYVSGKLHTQSWEKDGVKHYSTEIIADEMKMLEPRGGNQERETTPSHDGEYQSPGLSDDVPF